MKTSRDTSILNARGRGRGRGGGRVERGRGGTSGSKTSRNAVVSSSGVFSEGAGDGATKRLFRSFRGADETNNTTLRRPTLSMKREKVDPLAEQKHIAEIYDLEMDELEDSSKADNNEELPPIILNQGKFYFCSEHVKLSF